jgi:replicative DNA helicase
VGTSDGKRLSTFDVTVEERLKQLRSVLERRARGETVELFIPTGLRDWDERGGLERGILTVIGAATGDGKSMVKLHLARAAAQRGYRVLMIDFEDPAAKTADRAVSTIAGIDNRTIGKVDFDPFDYDRLEEAWKELRQWGKNIVHSAGLLTTEQCLDLMTEGNWDLVLIDYAQAFPEDDDKNMERTLKDFSWAAGQVAQEQQCAVVIFSQLKAEVEQRGAQRFEQWKQWGSRTNPNQPDISGWCPNGLADVAWAKVMADFAKCLLYIWRPGRRAQKQGFKKIPDNELWVICGKVSFGSEEDMKFKFDGPTATISDMER